MTSACRKSASMLKGTSSCVQSQKDIKKHHNQNSSSQHHLFPSLLLISLTNSKNVLPNTDNFPPQSPNLRTNNLLLQILNNARLLERQSTTKTMLTILSATSDLSFLDSGLECTGAHVEFLSWACGRNVEVEDIHWEAESCACAGGC